MSRFFHGGLGDSDSSSEEEEELYTESEEEEEEEEASEEESEDEDEAEASDSGSESGGDRFRAGGAYDSDDESDEGKRVVKSAKDKRLEEIEGSAKAIENAKRINDWVTISNGRGILAMVRHGFNADGLCLQSSTSSTGCLRRSPAPATKRRQRSTSRLLRIWRTT